MNFKKLLLSLLFLLFLLKAEKSLASHVAGGRMSYQYIGPNQYLLTLILYRDCGGVTLPTTSQICYSSASTLQAGNFTVMLIPGGPGVLPITNCAPLSPGCFEEWIYQGIGTLPGAATDWVFSWDLCCRSFAISTLAPVGGNSTGLYATLDNLTYPINSSPAFMNQHSVYYCLNNPSTYNFTCTDGDGDSLVYSLIPAQSAPGCSAVISNVAYIPPYSATNPLSSSVPIAFNPATSVLNFTPDLLMGTVISGLVEEYRNGTLIGSVKTDAMVLIVNGMVNPNIIKGKVYYDNNNNQVYDAGDSPAYGEIIETTPGNYYGSSNLTGDYSIYEPMGSYFITIPSPPYFHITQPLNHTAVFTVPFQTDSLNDFGLIISDSVQDLRITLTGIPIFGIGFNRTFNLSYINAGAYPMTGTINLVHDNLISYVSSTTPPNTINGDTLSWLFSNLMPMAGGSINVVFHLPAGTPPGTPLLSYAEILPVVNDSLPSNNSDTLYQMAQVSCDPNFKVVEPSGPITTTQVANGEFLEYTIHFQNTGTATAINVTITDTLDLNFNIPTFEVFAASHNYTWNITGPGIIEFSFLNIMLPDSGTNEPASHGFIKYRIKPNSSLVQGDKMMNTAYIYFDSNPAVVTNTTSTTVINPTSVYELPSAISDILIYPNPANDILNIEIHIKEYSHLKIQLFNILGKLEGEIENSSVQNGLYKKQISINNFSAGIYFIRIADEKASGFYKIIKQ